MEAERAPAQNNPTTSAGRLLFKIKKGKFEFKLDGGFVLDHD